MQTGRCFVAAHPTARRCSQVLPDGMVILCEPSPAALVQAVAEAVQRVPGVDPVEQHRQASAPSICGAVNE
jgi:hypothetical protein